MNIVKTNIEGVLILSHASSVMLVATSSRVSASESLKKRLPLILGHSVHFCQDNESMSSYG